MAPLARAYRHPSKEGIRDDGGASFNFIKHVHLVRSAEEIAAATQVIKPGITTADFQVEMTVYFNRVGSPTIQKATIAIPMHEAISEPARSK